MRPIHPLLPMSSVLLCRSEFLLLFSGLNRFSRMVALGQVLPREFLELVIEVQIVIPHAIVEFSMTFILSVSVDFIIITSDYSLGYSDSFTLCYSSNQGYLSVGGIDTGLYDGAIAWTSCTSSSVYEFIINDIRVYNSSVGSVSEIF